jgi:ADP-ribose pyrophosphatase
MFKVIDSKTFYEGKVLKLQVDEIEYASSKNIGLREVAIHPGGAVIVPINNDGKFVLVKQFRYPLKIELIEFPAGKLDNDEDPITCARRELEEETGYSSSDISYIGKFYTAPGYCTELLHIFLAKNLKTGNHRREEGENEMQIIELTLDEIQNMIKQEKILDSKTISALFLLQSKGVLNSN